MPEATREPGAALRRSAATKEVLTQNHQARKEERYRTEVRTWMP